VAIDVVSFPIQMAAGFHPYGNERVDDAGEWAGFFGALIAGGLIYLESRY